MICTLPRYVAERDLCERESLTNMEDSSTLTYCGPDDFEASFFRRRRTLRMRFCLPRAASYNDSVDRCSKERRVETALLYVRVLLNAIA